MSLVPAKCPECGGNINIDPEKRLGVCEYCKEPFVVQEAIQNFNTTYNITNNNEIKADIVNVYESKNDDFEIEAGVLKKYKGADTVVLIPEGVFEIDSFCFKDMKYLKEIVMPEGVRTISGCACVGCPGLEKVTIPESVENIERSAFYGSKLKELIAPDTLDRGIYIFSAPYLFANEIDSEIKRIALEDKPRWISSNLIDELVKLKPSKNGLNQHNEATGPFEDSPYFEDMCKYIISNRNPVDKNIVHDSLEISANSEFAFLGVYGHYFLVEKEDWDGYKWKLLGYCKECFTSTEQLEEYVADQNNIYIDKCKRQKKCPYCGGSLGLFSKCKSCGKQI